MVNVKILGSVVAIVLGFYFFTGSDDKTSKNSDKNTNLESKMAQIESKPQIQNKSNIVKETKTTTITRFEKPKQNNYKKSGFGYSKNKSKTISYEKLQQIRQKNYFQAKKRYQETQKRVALQKKMMKSRENYLNMQKMFSSKNPNSFKNNPKMMQDKFVRAQMAKNNFFERQKRLEAQMKMQQKIMNQNR